jgi:hypothetical protein
MIVAIMLCDSMLTVIELSVIMMTVVAPLKVLWVTDSGSAINLYL